MTEHEYAAYIYHKMRNEGDDVDAYKRGILDAIEMLTKLIYPNIYNRIEKIEVFSIGLAMLFNTSIDYILEVTDIKEPYPRKI